MLDFSFSMSCNSNIRARVCVREYGYWCNETEPQHRLNCWLVALI